MKQKKSSLFYFKEIFLKIKEKFINLSIYIFLFFFKKFLILLIKLNKQFLFYFKNI
jgi:hypothetical protein